MLHVDQATILPRRRPSCGAAPRSKEAYRDELRDLLNSKARGSRST
jgi:hypothetical protein